MDSEDLNAILDSFIEIMKGDKSQGNWIERCVNSGFHLEKEYPGVVERIINKNTAIVIISNCDGKQVWECEEKYLAKAVMLGNRLRSLNKAVYTEDHHINEILQEGDRVMVQVRLCDQGSIFRYFVYSCYKYGSKVEEEILSKITDPLRGVVEKMTDKEGVIKFQTYAGDIIRANFSKENLYQKGIKINEECPITSVVQENTLVYLELSEREGNYEKNIKENGDVLEASIVWLKDDQMPPKESKSKEAKSEGDSFSSEREMNENSNSSDCHQGCKNENMSDNNGIKGTLVSVDPDWGCVAVGKKAYAFKSSAVSFFGLKVESLPLNKIFNPDQIVMIILEEEEIKALKYGTHMLPFIRKEAISIYCEQNSISDEIKNSLVNLLKIQFQE